MWLPEITYKPTQREDRTKSLVEGVGGGGRGRKICIGPQRQEELKELAHQSEAP